MIRLVFPVTAADQRNAAAAIARNIPVLRWLRILLPIVAVAMIAWSMLEGWPFGLALFRNSFWIFLALVEYVLAFPMATWLAVRAMRKMDPNWAEEQTIEFDDTGLVLRSPSSTFSFQWNEVRRIAATAHTWLLYVGTKVAFIPLRVPAESGVLPVAGAHRVEDREAD